MRSGWRNDPYFVLIRHQMTSNPARPKVAALLYPGCIFFEIALAAEELAKSCELRFFTPDGSPHAASNGSNLLPAGSYQDLENAEVACVLLPGGDPQSIVPDRLASAALKAAAARGAVLASICAGNLVLASTGLLVGRRATHNYTLEHAPAESVEFTRAFWEGTKFERADVVVDGPYITAQPWAYAKYAAAVMLRLGLASEEEAKALVAYQRRSYTES